MLSTDYMAFDKVYIIWPKMKETWRNNAKNIKRNFRNLIKKIKKR